MQPPPVARLAEMTAGHILIPIHDFSAGGTEIVAFRLAARWIAEGRRVTILAGSDAGPMRGRVPEGADVRLLNPPVPRALTSRLRLPAPMAHAAREIAPDVVFIPGNFHFGLGAALRRELPNSAIIAKISNPLVPAAADRLPAALIRPVLRRITRGIDTLVAMSEGLAADAARLLPGREVVTIHDAFLPDDAVVMTRSGRPADRAELRLIGIGRLEDQKDWALALRTLRHLRRSLPVRLTVFGEGPLRKRLEALRSDLGLSDLVTFQGFTSDVNAELDQSDMLLVSSRYEGGPAVAIEALARGIPFVSTDCSHLLRSMLAVAPELGTPAPRATPGALAEAVLRQAQRPYPGAEAIELVTSHHRETCATTAYLALFDRLCERPR